MKKLLLVDSIPSPIGELLQTVQTIVEESALCLSVQVMLIDPSCALGIEKRKTGLDFEKVKRSILLLLQYIQKIGHCDAVLVIADHPFAAALCPLLMFLARLYRKPFYLKPACEGLDLFIIAQKKPIRKFLLYFLRSMDGILTQTSLLKDYLSKLGCANVYFLPEWRSLPEITLIPKQCSSELRVIFLGCITKVEGPLILLDALKTVSEMSDIQLTCDFYGPIHNEIHDEFSNELKFVPNARYCGIAKAGAGSQLISQYDVLVLPTCYDAEWHLGTLIEAMYAGVPVIATQVHHFTDLVINGINGFLIPMQDSDFLAEAILVLAADPNLRKKMGQANHLRGQKFSANYVVEQLLKIIFPDLPREREGK
jgi:glycosyltransferase involved in cell wall biosynthesis